MGVGVKKNLPLALLGIAFVSLALATHCGSSPEPTSPSETVSSGCAQASDCKLPPAKCASSIELQYSTDPQCVGGQCRFTMASTNCNCVSDGCQFNETIGVINDEGGFPFPDPGDPPDAPQDHAMVSSPDAGTCEADGDASACVTPPSVCADQRWLAFFTNGSCIEHQCEWQVAYRDCGLGCANGGCIMNITK
jgi:hypothetical protein